MKVVAVEEHFSTREVLKADDMGKALSVGGAAYPIEVLLDIGEDRLAEMDAWGVDVQVISLTAPGAQQLDPKEAVPLLRDTNDRLAEAVARHPDRMAALAALPMTDAEAAPEFLPVLERAVALEVPVYLHPSMPPPAVSEAYYGGFSAEVSGILATAGWGWHIETGLHLLRLIVSGAFDRFPDLQVVVGHLGEALPFMLQRADKRLPQKVTGLERPISRYLCENTHLSVSGFFYLAPFLNALLEFGADRILFSVDYPFSHNKEGLPFLDKIPVSVQDREKIAHGNAERLFRL